MKNYLPKPDWLKIRLGNSETYGQVSSLLNEYGMHTICASGKCPNQGECWSRGTATFMIAGDICTRACRFCNTRTGKPDLLDEQEGMKIALLVEKLKLRHVVLTSVDRDDLADYGASHWVKVVRQIQSKNPNVTIETLIPDFNGDHDLIKSILDTGVAVISHNIETVERISPLVRNKASYQGSMRVLKYITEKGGCAKSGLMVGLGETLEEVLMTMRHLRESGCRILTIGQYLQPTTKHYPVKRYVEPVEFELYKQEGLRLGFDFVVSGPLVRSSYYAEKILNK
ncbi:MAG: lipoyl synthase [Bacteroidales bacterium]